MTTTRRIGVLIEVADAEARRIVSGSELLERLDRQGDLVVHEAPDWTTGLAVERIAALCEAEALDGVVVCGPASGYSALGEFVEVPGDRAVPVVYAPIVEQGALAKTWRHMEIALAKARHMSPRSLVEMEVERRIAVVGGNHSAYLTAEALVEANFDVLMLLTDPPSGCFYPVSEELVDKVSRHDGVESVPGAFIYRVSGGLGAFRLWISTPEGRTERLVGGVVLAVDAQCEPLDLSRELLDSGRVMGLREYGEKIAAGELENEAVCIWLDRGGTDRQCAGQAAMRFSRDHAKKGGQPTILFHNAPVYGTAGQLLYDQARASDVVFVRYDGQSPRISNSGNQLKVTTSDVLLPDRSLELSVDRLVVPAAASPSAYTVELARMFHQPLDLQGYLQPGNVRHRPVSSSRKGVFYVGGCHDECDPDEARTEALAVAAKLLALLPGDSVRVPVERIAVDTDKCALCLTCVRECPHGAIQPNQAAGQIEVLDPACWQCGICASVCPGSAVEHGDISREQMHAVLKVAGKKLLDRAPIVAFACRQSAVPAADRAAQEHLDLPDNVQLIDVPCAGRVNEQMVLDAIEQGARGVVVIGCHHDNCRSLWGSDLTRKRVDGLKTALETIGVGEGRVRFHTIAANEAHRLAHLLHQAEKEMPAGSLGDAAADKERTDV